MSHTGRAAIHSPSSVAMDWNLKSASEWDWDSLYGFSSRNQKQVKHLNPDAEGVGRIDSGHIYSLGCGGFSGSDSGYGSSSKSSVEGVSNVDKVSSMDASASSGEHVIGLKLGKRTYFGDVCTTGNAKSVVVAAKRPRTSSQSVQSPCCQVEGCNLDLKSAKDYHRRHRICESHSKSPIVVVAGFERRFCQQCSRFHQLSEFDEKKRSCRRRLSDHNARRRRPQPEAIQFSSSLSTSIFGDSAKAAKSFTWPSGCGFKFTQTGDSMSRQMMSNLSSDVHASTCAEEMISDKGLSFKSSASQIFSEGLEGSTLSCNLEMNPNFGGALSLLSTTSWGLDSGAASLLVNDTNQSEAMMHAEPQSWSLSPPQDSRVNSYEHGNISFQHYFQQCKTPYQHGSFYSNQME